MKEAHKPLRIQSGRHQIIYCSHCDKVRVRFGNLMLQQEQTVFCHFATFLAQTVQDHFALTPERELQLRFGEVCLCLNQDEAQELEALVQDGWLAIQRQKLEALLHKS